MPISHPQQPVMTGAKPFAAAPHFAIPGRGMTLAPKSTPWQKPPKFVKLDDACNYIFSMLMQPTKLREVTAYLENGIPIEALARILIFSGFSLGLWTPNLGMLLGRPIVYMLGGIANRAGIKAKLTNTDRRGIDVLVRLKNLKAMQANTTPDDEMLLKKPTNVPSGAKGLLSPVGV